MFLLNLVHFYIGNFEKGTSRSYIIYKNVCRVQFDIDYSNNFVLLFDTKCNFKMNYINLHYTTLGNNSFSKLLIRLEIIVIVYELST